MTDETDFLLDNLVKQEHTVDNAVSEVAVSGSFHLQLCIGSEPHLVIAGATKEDIGRIAFQVTGKRLEIRETQLQGSSGKHSGRVVNGDLVGRRGTSGSPIHVHVFVSSLTAFEQRGNSDCHLLGIDAAALSVKSVGSGDMTIIGVAKRLEMVVSGSGDVSAGRLECESASVTSSGSGDTEVTVVDRLDLQSSGSGEFMHRGVCNEVTIKHSGNGDIVVGAKRSITVTSSGSGDLAVIGNPLNREVRRTGSGDVDFL